MNWIKKIGQFFAKVFTSAPQWTVTVSTAVKLATPLAQTLVQKILGASAGNEAVNIAHEIVSDLGVVGTLVTNVHASPDAGVVAQVEAALNAIVTSLKALLVGGHIKNQALLDEVTTSGNLLIGEIEAILDVLPKKA